MLLGGLFYRFNGPFLVGDHPHPINLVTVIGSAVVAHVPFNHHSHTKTFFDQVRTTCFGRFAAYRQRTVLYQRDQGIDFAVRQNRSCISQTYVTEQLRRFEFIAIYFNGFKTLVVIL